MFQTLNGLFEVRIQKSSSFFFFLTLLFFIIFATAKGSCPYLHPYIMCSVFKHNYGGS